MISEVLADCAYKSEGINLVCSAVWCILQHILIFSQKNTGSGSGLWANKCPWHSWHSLRGSLVAFSYITVEMELLAVLPAWRGQHAILGLAGTAAVTHRTAKWRGRWLFWQHPLPSWPGWKGRDGEASHRAHWSRARPPLAATRAKG